MKFLCWNWIMGLGPLDDWFVCAISSSNETHRPVIITQNGEPRAVLQDPESYENMRNAIGLLKLISQGEIDVRNGRINSHENVFNDIENSLKEKL